MITSSSSLSLFKNNVTIISNTQINNRNDRHDHQQNVNALQSSVIAVLSIERILSSSLGPRSMSKLIINEKGQSLITSDGASILKNIRVKHPAASILVDIALSQDRDVGDGTTSVVLLCCQILNSIQPLAMTIHQTTLSSMLYEVSQYCIDVLDRIAIQYDNQLGVNGKEDVLLKIAGVSLGTKHHSYWNTNMIQIALSAIRNSYDKLNNTIDVTHNIEIIKLISNNNINNNDEQQQQQQQNTLSYTIDNSECLKGIVINTNCIPTILPQHRQQQQQQSNSILKCCIIAYKALKVASSTSSRTTLSTTDQLEQYINRKDTNIIRLYEKLVQLNVNIIFFKYEIPDYLVQLLIQKGISCVQNINDNECLNKLSTLTNSMLFTSEQDIDESMLGKLEGLSLLTKIDSLYYIYLKNSDTSYSTILLRGPSIDIVSDLEIGMIDALYLLKSAIESSPKFVYGGGCCEMALAVHLKHYAQQLDTHSPKRQLYLCISDCFTVIPKTLIANCHTSSPLKSIAKLEYLHSQFTNNHNDNKQSSSSSDKINNRMGIDGWTGEITDMERLGIIEPLILKKSIITTAFESCMTLLRIDTIISS
ncbi:hypothetical protein PPL_03720 [Heterostelium album PN500]|uniref:Uncharacterized protein n=1 Tax=Heterostelium pallidum (strain ATCC 26659 / Pp 5 / PN500) TaxID=670386 RepID=D3B6H2_HETP5|nr:hypothetical protein PPL_03720 [Heterostelium album PN500]EFA82942.1 hypothetical protein PPL_03720 [Heterostelium album PN500]|eukprot:XP_020435059.1 hypothetical protein PPL_03720 [Heterostelium album PN500]